MDVTMIHKKLSKMKMEGISLQLNNSNFSSEMLNIYLDFQSSISMKTLISIDKLQNFIYSLLGTLQSCCTIKQTVCSITRQYNIA
ncbi:hypothetical protein T10_8034 [Trichinella papuae]|uniref:Uncharacterized protein n=1 Tax=Trichinella papuae TaxID=268474 RepID=A0A0V1N8U4_9BILA|nr:hypothetical protein T10_8034 [Trichinella papuae]